MCAIVKMPADKRPLAKMKDNGYELIWQLDLIAQLVEVVAYIAPVTGCAESDAKAFLEEKVDKVISKVSGLIASKGSEGLSAWFDRYLFEWDGYGTFGVALGEIQAESCEVRGDGATAKWFVKYRVVNPKC